MNTAKFLLITASLITTNTLINAAAASASAAAANTNKWGRLHILGAVASAEKQKADDNTAKAEEAEYSAKAVNFFHNNPLIVGKFRKIFTQQIGRLSVISTGYDILTRHGTSTITHTINLGDFPLDQAHLLLKAAQMNDGFNDGFFEKEVLKHLAKKEISKTDLATFSCVNKKNERVLSFSNELPFLMVPALGIGV